MEPIDFKAAKRSILRKLISPASLAEMRRRSKTKGLVRRVDDDPELKLYSGMLENELLHFGYFDDPDLTGEEISIAMIKAAQIRYSEFILERVGSKKSGKVLDGGCGMGGLINPLRAAGHDPVALTPNRTQIAYLRKNYPDLAVENCMFEDLDTARYAGTFDTVINSESLQYIDLDAANAVVGKVLAPGGHWVIADFFRKPGSTATDIHLLDDFRTKAAAAGWRVAEDTDITANVLPTLDFAHTVGRKALPIFGYIEGKVARAAPGLHYLLEDVFEQSHAELERQLEFIRPGEFADNFSYRLFVLDRG